MAEEPESIGTGLGALMADYIPLMPSGARRAGAARVMAARIGRDPSFLVNDPIKTQLAAIGIGAIGNAFTHDQSPGIRLAATGLPLLLTQALRRREIKSIQEDYDTLDRKRLRELDTTDLFGGMGGSSRLGAVGAYEAMRKRKYQDIGSLSEAGDALMLATGGMALPATSWIDHRSADRMQKDAGLISRGIGRVVTNVVEPYGYSIYDKLRRVKSQGLMNNIKAVVEDKPAYKVVLGRDLPYRRMFGLPAHRGGLGYYTKNAPGSFRFRENSRKSDLLLSGVADDGLASARAGTPVGGTFHGKDHTVMAGYDGKLAPDDIVQYRDRWDVDLQPGERPIDDASAMARWIMSKFTKPVTIEGQVNARTLQSGAVKKADFSDQKNSPTIPLYLAAALASTGGLAAAGAWAQHEIENTPTLSKDQWAPLVRHVSGGAPPVYSIEGLNNAGYIKPRSEREGRNVTEYVRQFPRVEPPAPEELMLHRNHVDEKKKLHNRIMQHGAIIADSNSPAGILAHEGGHAKIENTPGALRFLQRHVYPHHNLIAPLAGVGSMAAGLASGSTLKGALLGTGIGLVSGLGTIAPEIGASYHGIKGMDTFNGGALSSGQKSPLAAALSTYLAAAVLPSALSGAAGGWISGNRRRKEAETLDEDAEKVE